MIRVYTYSEGATVIAPPETNASSCLALSDLLIAPRPLKACAGLAVPACPCDSRFPRPRLPVAPPSNSRGSGGRVLLTLRSDGLIGSSGVLQETILPEQGVASLVDAAVSVGRASDVV